MEKGKLKIKQLGPVLLIILMALFFLNSSVISLEIQYPQASTLPQYLKYLFNLIIILAGLIGLAVLIWGGIKWLTSAGEPAKISEAKSQILYGLLGLGLLLSSYLILAAINPELTLIRFPFFKGRVPAPGVSLPTQAKPKTILAYEIPLGKLIDGNLIEGDYLSGGIPESDASYKKAQITQTLLDEYKSFGSELEGKWREIAQETDPLKMEKLKQELQAMRGRFESSRFRESYFTKIEKVAEKANEVLSLAVCQQEGACLLSCEVEREESSPYQCRISGLKRLLELIETFQGRKNNEIEIVKNELEKAVNNIKDILNLDLIKGTAGLSKLSDLNEKYDSETENLVKEIVGQSKAVKIVKCCQAQPELEKKITELQTLAEVFQEGYQIRKDLWEVSKQSIEIKKELDSYRDLEEANLKLKGSDYVYEGAVPSSRLDRISDLNSRMREKSNQIKTVSLTMNTAAGVIAALTATCNCVFCGCACGPCFGDPCAPVRPALIASQAVLAGGAATLPPLSSQLQKEVNKEEKEREELKNSVQKSTEGLEKAEVMLKTCVGKRGPYQLNLLSLHNFLNYKTEVEKIGYQVRIIKTRPEVQIKDDTYTYYCVEGPVIPGITESSYPLPSSPYGRQKVICEREIEVGELMDSVEGVIKDENQVLDQMKRGGQAGQVIINEASKMSPSGTSQGVSGDLLQKNLPPELADKIPRQVFQTLSGEQLNTVFKDTFQSMPEKYAKDTLSHLFENLPVEKNKEIFSQALGAMPDQDLKSFLSDYFDSLKNEKKKKVSQAIFEGMAGSETKKALTKALPLLEAKDNQALWKEALSKMGQEGREQFFESLFEKIPEKDLLKLSDQFLTNLSPAENRQLLGKILERAPSQITSPILEKYSGQNVGEKIDSIPTEELKEVSQKTGSQLYEAGYLKGTLQAVPEDSWQRTINRLPPEALKETGQTIFESLPETKINDLITFDILESDPNFLPRMLKYVPEEKIKGVFLNDILGPMKGDDFKEALSVGTKALSSDPRAILNSLMLKQVPEGDKLMKAADIIANQTYDEFFGEAIDVMPGLAGVKDMLDKISPYIQDIKKTVNSVLDAISLTQAQIGGLVGDVLGQLSETKLREISKELKKFLPTSEIKKLIPEISPQLPSDDLRKAIKDLSELLRPDDLRKAIKDLSGQLSPETMRKIIKDLSALLPEELRLKTLKDLKTISDAQLPDLLAEVLAKISDLKLPDALSQVLKEISDAQLADLLPEILKKISPDKLGQALKSFLEWVPDLKLPETMKEISKAIPPELLRDYLNLNLDNLPLSTNKLLDQIFKGMPPDTLKKISDGIFKDLDFGSAKELMEKLASYRPDKLLGPYIEKITGFVKEKLGGVLADLKKSFPDLNINLGNFGDILGGIFSGKPALKENAREDVLLPPQFTSAPCGCACPGGVPTPCVGQTPPGPYSEVLKRFSYISSNNLTINLNQAQLQGASQQTDYLINKKIKEDIYGGLRNSRKDFGQCIGTPAVEKQLYKCQEARNYGWLEKCQDPFNFVCCYPVK